MTLLQLSSLLLILNAYLLQYAFCKTKYPNFVMILLDDIGWGDPSYNNGTTYTPNLDAWTKEANTITFHRGYAGINYMC